MMREMAHQEQNNRSGLVPCDSYGNVENGFGSANGSAVNGIDTIRILVNVRVEDRFRDSVGVLQKPIKFKIDYNLINN